MNSNQRNKGFSLTEVLMAIGIMVVGMLFVAGVFPVAIYLTTRASEQTMASTVADEAFAKIRLIASDPNCIIYSSDFNNVNSSSFETAVNKKRLQFWQIYTTASFTKRLADDEFAYPSTNPNFSTPKHFYWSAICRRPSLLLSDKQVQVTVFVSKTAGSGATYWDPNTNKSELKIIEAIPQPKAMRLEVAYSTSSNRLDELVIKDRWSDDVPHEKILINDGTIIVDDATGQIYRVLERYAPPKDDTILLDRPWSGSFVPAAYVWAVPPPVNGGKNAGIAVYQKIIEF